MTNAGIIIMHTSEGSECVSTWIRRPGGVYLIALSRRFATAFASRSPSPSVVGSRYAAGAYPHPEMLPRRAFAQAVFGPFALQGGGEAYAGRGVSKGKPTANYYDAVG